VLDSCVPRIIVDFDPPLEDVPSSRDGSAELVYFLSWAYAGRYGASHEMAVAAEHIRHQHAVDLRPLITFADNEAEDGDDRDLLELAWQDPSKLAQCIEGVVRAFRSGDEALGEVLEEYPALVGQLEELGSLAARAEQRGARIRVTYELEDSGA